MPLNECAIAVRELRKWCYRPIRFRPYADGKVVRVATVWTRDRLNWQFEPELSATDVRLQIEKRRKVGLAPVDVASYLTLGSDREPIDHYAVVWVETPQPEAVRAYFGETADSESARCEQFKEEGLVPLTVQVTTGVDGLPRSSGIWGKPPSAGVTGKVDRDLFEGELATIETSRNDQVILDLTVSAAGKPQTIFEHAQTDRDRAENALKSNPGNSEARRSRAIANFRLGENAKALDDFNLLVARNRDDLAALQYRTIVHARLRQQKESDADVRTIQIEYLPDHSKLFVQTVVAAELGQKTEKLVDALDAAFAKTADDAELRYNAARAFALASHAVGRRDQAEGRRLAARALTVVKELVQDRDADFGRIDQDPAFDPIRDDPAFGDVKKLARHDRRYATVWSSDATVEMKTIVGRSPDEQLDRSQQLAAQGFYPVAMSVARTRPDGPLVSASVWRRPLVSEEEKDQVAERQARAAVAMVRMGKTDGIWALLRYSSDPRLRSFIVNWLQPLGARPGPVVTEFSRIDPNARPAVNAGQPAVDAILFHQETSIRRALILALGKYEADDLSASEREALVAKLLELHRNDPDAGIHGAAESTLRRWKQEDKLKATVESLAKLRDPGERRWYVNGQRQTFTIINEPVQFDMGSPPNEPGRIAGNEPRRLITIPRRFAIATREVTIEQFQTFVKSNDQYAMDQSTLNRYSTSPDGPWIGCDWYGAAAYCNWLSEQEGLPKDQFCYLLNEAGALTEGTTIPANVLERTGYRLPTEAEWEYACRAGAITSRYYGASDELLDKYAWYQSNSHQRGCSAGALLPNELGLFDTLGNAYEWCQDQFRAYRPARKGVYRDEVVLTEQVLDRRMRIFRGGTNSDLPDEVRSASRAGDLPTLRSITIGFRVARTWR
jgi:formylglycine-generating enzyme required for sulfatase activity